MSCAETNPPPAVSLFDLPPHRLIWPRWSATLYPTLCGITLIRDRGLLHHNGHPNPHIRPSRKPNHPHVPASHPVQDLLSRSQPPNPLPLLPPESQRLRKMLRRISDERQRQTLDDQCRLQAPTKTPHPTPTSSSRASRTSLQPLRCMAKHGATIQR